MCIRLMNVSNLKSASQYSGGHKTTSNYELVEVCCANTCHEIYQPTYDKSDAKINTKKE